MVRTKLLFVFALCSAACRGLCVKASPLRGERGYKRHQAKEAVRRVLRELKHKNVPPLPPLASSEGGDDVSPLEQQMAATASASEAAHVPLGPVGAAPWGTGVPRGLEPECQALCGVEEEEALLALKRALAVFLPEPSNHDFRPVVHGDVRLLRFLRKFGTPDSAAEAYRHMLDWRARTGVDEALRVEEGCDQSMFPKHEELHSLMPVDVLLDLPATTLADGSFCGSHQMRMSIGRWDTHGLMRAVRDRSVTEIDFLNYWIRVNEMIALSLDAASRAHGKLVTFTIVCDFEQTTWRQFSRPFLDLMKLWAAVSDYYPATSREILFVNTPFYFRRLWQFIQPVLNEDTKSKIRLVRKSSDSRDEKLAAPV